MLRHPCILRDQAKGNKIRSGCLTPYFYFFGSRSRIEISVGRITKKAYLAFFFKKKSVTHFFLSIFCCRSRIKKSVGRVTKKA